MRGGILDLMKAPIGNYSTQSKFKKPKMSNSFNAESIAVGVEMNRITKIVKRCNIILLNRKRPRLDPPIFFHMISIGSLAIFMSNTSSLITPSYYTCAS
jgi:hypothetical protein